MSWRVSSGMRGLPRSASETVFTEKPVLSAISFSRTLDLVMILI
jgi:hypothetical protein